MAQTMKAKAADAIKEEQRSFWADPICFFAYCSVIWSLAFDWLK